MREPAIPAGRPATALAASLLLAGALVAATAPAAADVGAGTPSAVDSPPTRSNETVIDFRAAFERHYGGRDVTSALAAAGAPGGDLFLAGSRYRPDADDEDAWLARVSGAGDVEWARTYHGAADDWANAVTATDDGGVLLAGSTGSTERTGNAWLVKTNATGGVEWERTYNRSRRDSANAVVQTGDGGYLFGGTTGATDGAQDAWLVKTNATGGVEWERTYGRYGDDWANAVFRAGDGYAFVGFTRSAWDPGDAWLVEVNATGAVTWNATYGGYRDDEAATAIRAADGGYLLAGATNTSDRGVDGWLVKTNESGAVAWTNTYGGDGYDTVNAAVQTADGGYLFTGASNSDGPFFDQWVVRVSPEGSAQVTATYGDALTDLGSGLVPTEGGYLVVGTADWGFGGGNASLRRIEPVSFARRTPDASRRAASTSDTPTIQSVPSRTPRSVSPSQSPAPSSTRPSPSAGTGAPASAPAPDSASSGASWRCSGVRTSRVVGRTEPLRPRR